MSFTTVAELAAADRRDLKAKCLIGAHNECDGILHAKTGWHWFCTCDCHGTPTVRPGQEPALELWRLLRGSQAPPQTEDE